MLLNITSISVCACWIASLHWMNWWINLTNAMSTRWVTCFSERLSFTERVDL